MFHICIANLYCFQDIETQDIIQLGNIIIEGQKEIKQKS